MKNILVNLIVSLLLLGLSIVLQIYLSKKKNKYLGLILPSISFIYSLIIVLNLAASEEMTLIQIIITLIVALLQANIMTIVYLLIYIGIKEKMKLRSEIDKMNIKDL